MEKRLSKAPLVKAEFARIGPLPQSGPVIICEPKGPVAAEATSARDGTHCTHS